MKRLTTAFLLLAGLLLGYRLFAQTAAPYQFSVSPSTTTSSCTPVASQTTYCFAGNGVIYVSVNGGAFSQQLLGVQAITINGGAPQTGVVPLTIPSKATVTVPAQTVSGTLQ